MRNGAIAVLGLAIVVAAALYLGLPRPPSTSTAAPTPTSTLSGISATPTPTVAASPAPLGGLGAVTIQMTRTTVPAEFRYLVLAGGDEFRLVVLDLDAGSSTQIATARIASPGTPTELFVTVAPSADGRTVLLTFVVPDAADSVFVVRPENGDARLLLRAEIRGAVISSDGTRVAIGRNDEDRAFTGLWVGTVADGAMRRLVADDPQSNASPPLPYAFSPDGALLAFGLGLGEIGRRAMVAPVGSSEGRVDRVSGDTTRIVGIDVATVGPASGAEFRSARDLFVWSSRSAFGGETVAYLYDLTAKRSAELHRPSGDTLITAAAWRPNAEQYATIERPMCCGVFVTGTAAWLRGRDGSARTLLDAVDFIDLWWSRDGSRLFARGGADDSVGAVTDLLTGKRVLSFCLRGGGPPPAACT
jgi:hypothetical protein